MFESVCSMLNLKDGHELELDSTRIVLGEQGGLVPGWCLASGSFLRWLMRWRREGIWGIYLGFCVVSLFPGGSRGAVIFVSWRVHLFSLLEHVDSWHLDTPPLPWSAHHHHLACHQFLLKTSSKLSNIFVYVQMPCNFMLLATLSASLW